MVAEAIRNSPELKGLDEAIAIQERLLTAANRAFFMPTVALQGQVDNTVYKGGEGTETMPGAPDDVNWALGVSVTLPIYAGNEVMAKRRAHKEEMLQTQVEREAAARGVEQRVRVHLHQAGASYAGFKQATKAAEAADKSLDMVAEAYARGVASVVDVIDAQTQQQIAQEAASDALFDYLLKLMLVQRAAGQFDFFRSAKDMRDFKARLAGAVVK
ncbi:MAG: TolC family protein, partial [Planctomycetota bacterium]|jgi:outer membrane protein TolC